VKIANTSMGTSGSLKAYQHASQFAYHLVFFFSYSLTFNDMEIGDVLQKCQSNCDKLVL